MRLETSVTRLLGIRLPILQAGMSWASSNAALPCAVSQAGGLGVIAAGPMYVEALEQAIDEVRAGTDQPFGVNMPLYRKGADDVLDLLEAKRIPILIASQGGPSRYLDRFKAIGTKCIHVVASEEHAVKAMNSGVDALVAVGGEAGGHPPPELVSTLVLTRAVLRATENRIPVIASGGFADGYGLAAALSLGAGAANFGTRFIASPEAGVTEAYKTAVVSAGVSDTRTVGRGLGMIRALKNDFTDRMEVLEAAGKDIDARRAAFLETSLKTAAFDGDIDRGKVEAGQSVGLVDHIMPAGDIVAAIARDYLDAVKRLPRAEPESQDQT